MDIILTGAKGFVGSILEKELKADNHNVIHHRNIEEYDDKSIDEIKSQFKEKTKPGCLLHCARHHGNIIGEITQEKWLDEFKQDVYLPFLTTKALYYAGLIDNVIFTSSIYGVEPPKVRWIPENYVASKAAEIHLAKYLALQLAPKCRVNIIILGGVHSDRPAAFQTGEFRHKYNQRVPLNHMVCPGEIYGAVKFLIGNGSKGMTGSEIKIDGGYTI